VQVPGVDPAVLDVYAEDRTPLTAPILDALPRIAQIGRGLFGQAPPIRFFLFARLPRFARFYDLFKEPGARRTDAPHSTGGLNMVIFCEQKAHRGTTAETVSLALHETMHAWAATYLRRSCDRPVSLPAYVDEGLATYVAGLWSPEVAALAAPRLAAWRSRGLEPPPLEALRKPETFYAPPGGAANYWLSEQLIERLIGPPQQGAAKIRAFLDAYAKSGDDLEAWRAVSGKDAAAEYAALK
jgi:hypothetical protein